MESINIKPCTVADFEAAPNLTELLTEYGAESSIEGLGRPAAQMETYRQMEAAGFLHLFGAFQEGTLVGFLVMIVSVLPHYGVKVASTESYFVARSARKTGAGLKLLHKAERLARTLGAAGFFVSAPMGSKLADVLDAYTPYRETNRVFFRGLL